jgi:hypothetical protein
MNAGQREGAASCVSDEVQTHWNRKLGMNICSEQVKLFGSAVTTVMGYLKALFKLQSYLYSVE